MRSNGHRGRGAGRDDMNRHPSGRSSANLGPLDAGDHAIIAALVGDPLGRLLAAAAAPGSTRELLGEEAPLLPPSDPPRRCPCHPGSATGGHGA